MFRVFVGAVFLQRLSVHVLENCAILARSGVGGSDCTGPAAAVLNIGIIVLYDSDVLSIVL
jgi:hypothetical protein